MTATHPSCARRASQLLLAIGLVLGVTTVLAASPEAPSAAASASSGRGSVGIYPARVVFAQALRGGRYSQSFGLINGGSAQRLFYFSTRGQLGPWLSVVSSNGANQPLRSVRAKPGSTTLSLRLRVPASTPNGTYTGAVVVESPPPKTGQGSTVGLGTEVQVSASVTGAQVIAGKLLDAYTYPEIEVGSPVTVFARVHDAGNVAITPAFRLVVTRGKSAIFRHTFKAGTVQPSSLAVLQFRWPGSATKSQSLGQYEGHLSVSFGTLDLGSRTMMFKLVPYGSLHRGGRLLGLKLLNQPHTGYSAEVQAAVQSMGKLQQETTFVGQLYRSGALVQAVKSPAPVLLQPGESGVINVAVPVPKNGLYKLTGVANFAGAQSKTMTLTFRVGPAPLALAYKVAIAAGAAVVVVVLIGLVWFRRRRGRRPPAAPEKARSQPRYAATHPLTLHVPPEVPAGSSPGRPAQRSRRS